MPALPTLPGLELTPLPGKASSGFTGSLWYRLHHHALNNAQGRLLNPSERSRQSFLVALVQADVVARACVRIQPDSLAHHERHRLTETGETPVPGVGIRGGTPVPERIRGYFVPFAIRLAGAKGDRTGRCGSGETGNAPGCSGV
jgi:hypothetical protein